MGLFPTLAELYPDCLSTDEWRRALSDEHRRLQSDRFTALRIRKLQLLPVTATADTKLNAHQFSPPTSDTSDTADVRVYRRDEQQQQPQSAPQQETAVSLTVQGGECIAVMG